MKKVIAVGIGPGNEEYMTLEARKAIESCDVICGYTVYVDLVKPVFPDKEYYSTPMMKEMDRCRLAMEKAREGKSVAMVCSGDAGVYGMASPLIELREEFDDVEVEVVSGNTAAISGSAVLGAPLSHDFCVISLSDLLTPWEVIERRLEAAGQADFAIALYNPRSKKRSDYIEKAAEILMRHKSPDTVCGWVKNIGRDGLEKGMTTLDKLKDEPIDMFTTVFIGNRDTRMIGGQMVTPRGYQNKEE